MFDILGHIDRKAHIKGGDLCLCVRACFLGLGYNQVNFGHSRTYGEIWNKQLLSFNLIFKLFMHGHTSRHAKHENLRN